MASSANGGQSYAIHVSGAVAKRIKQLQKRAAQEGRGEQTLAALRQIAQRLTQDPFHCGEPLYRLPALRMPIRTVALGPLAVHFAVCEDRPLIFIKGAELLG
jgi:hypothetical protein